MTGRFILVVDDDEEVRNMLCLVLSGEGYPTAGAADGLEALRCMRNHEPPALVVLDLMMPRMDGEDLIRTMSADASLARIPVAVISGQTTVREPAPTQQVIARLVKPVELEELLSVVHRVADRAADDR